MRDRGEARAAVQAGRPGAQGAAGRAAVGRQRSVRDPAFAGGDCPRGGTTEWRTDRTCEAARGTASPAERSYRGIRMSTRRASPADLRCDSEGGTPALDAVARLREMERMFDQEDGAVRTYAPAGTEAVLERLLEEPSLAAAVTHHALIPAREAITAPFPTWLDRRIVRGLEDRGITSL